MSTKPLPTAVPILGYGIAAGLVGSALCCFWPGTWLAASLAASSARRAAGEESQTAGNPGVGVGVGLTAGLVAGTLGPAGALQMFGDELAQPLEFALGYGAVALMANLLFGLLGGSFGAGSGNRGKGPPPSRAVSGGTGAVRPPGPKQAPPTQPVAPSETAAGPAIREPVRLLPEEVAAAGPLDSAAEGPIRSEDERAAWEAPAEPVGEDEDTIPPDPAATDRAQDPAGD